MHGSKNVKTMVNVSIQDTLMYFASVYYITLWNGVRAPHSLNLDGNDFSPYITNYILVCGRNFPSRTKCRKLKNSWKVFVRRMFKFWGMSRCAVRRDVSAGLKDRSVFVFRVFGMFLNCLTLKLEKLWSLECRTIVAQQQDVASLKTWIFNNTAVRNWDLEFATNFYWK